ncbi:armadillo-type protein [Phlyctochytrium arcticum]|nr:armadillo-type protein [Phlyctochytrium arcticum]
MLCEAPAFVPNAMSLDQLVLTTLSECLSADPETRKQAEERAKGLARMHPEYPKYLAHISLSEAFPENERQLAAVTLRKYVSTHWSMKEDKFEGPEPPAHVKAEIKAMILPGIKSENKRIRVLIAYVVSRIAHFDWPELWPELLGVLMADIRGSQPNAVHGAMRVLTEFVRDDLTDQHIPYVAPSLLPELHRIFASSEYSPRDRSRALGMFRDFSEIVYMVSEEHPHVVASYIEPLLPTWIESFKAVLSTTDVPAEALPIKHEVLRTLCTLSNHFSKSISPHTILLLEPVWNHLVALQSQYLQERVNPPSDGRDIVDVDSDGEVLGIESLLYSLFEFIQLAARKKPVRHVFTTSNPGTGFSAGGSVGAKSKRQAGGFLNQLMSVSLTYMQMTNEMEETWTNDMNQFIQDDEEEALSFNVRVAVERLIITFGEAFPSETLQALCTAVQQQLQEAIEARDAGVKVWWKMHEACLLALGRVNEELIEAIQSESVSFDLEGLFNHIVLQGMKYNEHPFLQGRSLWFASQFAEVLPSDLIAQYMGAAVEALNSDVATAAVKVSALKALRGFCFQVDPETLAPFQAPIIEGILRLSESATEEALALLIETLGTAAKVNEEVTARYQDMMSTLLLHAWMRGAEDFYLTEIIFDLFNILASNHHIAIPFQEKVIPAIRDVLKVENMEKMPWAVATALTFITALVKNVPEPFPTIYSQQIFPDVIRILLTVDDSGVLQNGEDTITALIQRDLPGIAQWRSEEGKSGLDYVIQLVAKLLQPSQSESASLFVGELVTRLIQKGGNDLVPLLPQLLSAVAKRLQGAKTSDFIQQLVMVFAHLVISQPDTVLDFLTHLDLDGKNGLELVLEMWCDHFADFQGFYSIKVSALAMSKLLERLEDPRLARVMVRGDEIVTTDKIVTRSMTQKQPTQYTTIPFPVKAVKLLLGELQSQVETQMGRGIRRGRSDDFDDDDDEGGHEEEGDLSYEEGNEEWEDVDPTNGDSFLAGLIDTEGVIDVDCTDDEGADQALWEDPIYQMDLKGYLANFLKETANQHTTQFTGVCDQYLNEREKTRMHTVLTSPAPQPAM